MLSYILLIDDPRYLPKSVKKFNPFNNTPAIVAVKFPAYIFFENVYWMIKCLRHGGDWRYYADRIFATIFVTLAIIGIALLTYGSNI